MQITKSFFFGKIQLFSQAIATRHKHNFVGVKQLTDQSISFEMINRWDS